MDCRLFVLLIHFGFGIISCVQIVRREYHYVDQQMTWTDAQKYCREKYSDLATFQSMEDIKKLKRPETDARQAWIGLYDDPNSWMVRLGNDTNSWRWSATEAPSRTGYHNWIQGQPNYAAGQDLCVKMTHGSEWADVYCTEDKSFVCYSETKIPGEKSYQVIEKQKTWLEAKDYCREHYKDLAMVESAEENSRVHQKSQFDVWIGLYRVPWRWSDGSTLTFRNWLSGEPNSFNFVEHCAVEYPGLGWNDVPCDGKYPFICHQDFPNVRKTMVKMRIRTDGGLSDGAALQQALFVKFSKAGLKAEWKIKPKEEE